MSDAIIVAIIVVLILIVALWTIFKTAVLVRQAQEKIVERLGKYSKTLNSGLHIIIPFVDRVRYMWDMREQVQVFQPQSVITRDNLVISIDSVVYYQIVDSKSATYEIQDFLVGIEQLAITTLRNVIGGLDLEQTLSGRDAINTALRETLDKETGKWGVRVGRVEIRSINPPATITQAMEMQVKAEREKRANILVAEGDKQSAILKAEGYKQATILQADGDQQAAVLKATGEKQAQVLVAEGEAQAIENVVTAIHRSNVDAKVLAYKQLTNQPLIADGQASKVWVIPSELTGAAGAVARAMKLGDDIGPIKSKAGS